MPQAGDWPNATISPFLGDLLPLRRLEHQRKPRGMWKSQFKLERSLFSSNLSQKVVIRKFSNEQLVGGRWLHKAIAKGGGEIFEAVTVAEFVLRWRMIFSGMSVSARLARAQPRPTMEGNLKYSGSFTSDPE